MFVVIPEERGGPVILIYENDRENLWRHVYDRVTGVHTYLSCSCPIEDPWDQSLSVVQPAFVG